MSNNDGDGTKPQNPFDDIMGGGQESAPNPFGGGGGAPPAGGDMMNMLGLDTPQPTDTQSGANKKRRPELDEWSQGVGTGPKASSSQPDLVAASSASAEQKRIAALAPPKEKGAAAKLLPWLIGVIVLVVGVGIAQRMMKKSALEEKAAQAKPEVTQTDQLMALGIRPENPPSCWVRDKGFKFTYVEAGKEITVNSIGDVPVSYRDHAKCIPVQ